MSGQDAILDLYLGQAYAAQHLGKGNPADVFRLLSAALEANADLRAEAERRRSMYEAVGPVRCVITANHLSVLEKVLKEVRA
ncbi:hypothetical protein [Ancylobacter sp.]|uniref:hypothetical protein n=1 Tax=Ancylobacter sp. TaxID=1872567 RepID=UPI003BAAE544